jgi:hypothetical protein
MTLLPGKQGLMEEIFQHHCTIVNHEVENCADLKNSYRLVPVTSTVSVISFSLPFLNPVFVSHFFISNGV